MKVQLFSIFLFLSVVADAAVRARAFRQIRIGNVLHEMVFYSKIRNNEPPSFEEVATMGLGFADEEVFKKEIAEDENWKFDQFQEEDYLTPERDGALIGSIRSFEALELHDEILVLKRLEWESGKWVRRTVGMIAFKYQWPDKENLLFEDRQKLKLEVAPIFPFSKGASQLPHHWRSYPRSVSMKHRKWGGYLQINSVISDKKYKTRYLYYLIAGAYWHGLFTGGPIVREGEKFLGTKAKYTTSFTPLYYVGEGYGSRAFIWSKWNMKKLMIEGKEEIPDYYQPERALSIMGTDCHSYWAALENYFEKSAGHAVFDIQPTGYLTLWPQFHPIIKLPGRISADLRTESQLLSCGVELARHSLGFGAYFPLKNWHPTVKSLR
jgi:hypothetical protein